MSFFNPNLPVICRKKSVFTIDDIPGCWRFHWQIGDRTIVSNFYTRLDQACLLWSVISITIFGTAQFIPIDWNLQAIIWSVLTLGGTICMVVLTQYWVEAERLMWILYSWVILMLVGLAITDLSIFLGWGEILIRLCDLWLGLSAIGYFLTGLGMRSRLMLLTGVAHVIAILILPYVGGWQFLTTGIVTGGSGLLLAELQWDSYGTCGANKLDYKI